jgi:hypothetical protein
MPGSLALATPTTVLPWSLTSQWQEDTYWATIQSEVYPDGSEQLSVQVAQPRRSWALTKRLNYTEWIALRDFFEARKGGFEPFYFYTDKGFYDALGVNTTGRYTVRFDGPLQSEYGLSRFVISLRLVEVV